MFIDVDMKLKAIHTFYICQIYSITNYHYYYNFIESNIWGRVATPIIQGQAHISWSKTFILFILTLKNHLVGQSAT